jgi:hypothetical protein
VLIVANADLSAPTPFFLPGSTAGREEHEYGRLQACALRATGCKPADERIQRLACRLGGEDRTIEVGELDPVGAKVLAILNLGRHLPYGVFTTADPDAPALLVGKRVYAVTKFR